VIILSNSDEQEELHEETATDATAVPSAAPKSSTVAAIAADANEDPWKIQDDNSDDLAPSQATGKSSGGGDEAGSP
jgi:hypothetical protein